jgi:hypothetical protein
VPLLHKALDLIHRTKKENTKMDKYFSFQHLDSKSIYASDALLRTLSSWNVV